MTPGEWEIPLGGPASADRRTYPRTVTLSGDFRSTRSTSRRVLGSRHS